MSFVAASAALDMDQMECGGCGIVFWVPGSWRRDKQATGADMHCPNGHVRVYRETDADLLRKQLAEKEAQLTQARENAERANRLREKSEKQVKSLKRRVANGVCPCCKRTVSQLARHMSTKHPGWEGQDVG